MEDTKTRTAPGSAGPRKPPEPASWPVPYALGSWVFRLVALALLALLALLLLPYAIAYVEGWENYAYLKSLMHTSAQAMDLMGGWLHRYVPTRIAGADRTLWILLGGVFVVQLFFGRLSSRLGARAEYLKILRNVQGWENEMGLDQNSSVTSELNSKLASLKEGKKKDRDELLRIFAETKRKLSGMGRELAFLSIDVVGSTSMKIGEDQESIEHDFKQYKILVDGIFQVNGLVKAAWTPDGVMACFSTIDTAVKAGKDVIRGLVGFNRDVKLMKTDFVVRCGVNAGFVYMDDTVPLQEVSDRVIDIAGHMQKYAEPNTVAVSKTVVEPMSHRHGFQETKKIVDGYQVYAWRAGDPD